MVKSIEGATIDDAKGLFHVNLAQLRAASLITYARVELAPMNTSMSRFLPFDHPLHLLRDFSSPEVEDTDVEKCLDDGTRGRGTGARLGVVVVWVVVVCELELARKRDWEWFEK